MEPAVINLDEMFPRLEHQGICYVLAPACVRVEGYPFPDQAY